MVQNSAPSQWAAFIVIETVPNLAPSQSVGNEDCRDAPLSALQHFQRKFTTCGEELIPLYWCRNRGDTMAYCDWGLEEINRKYHDEEWGVPVHDDRKQFEYLMMEVMQCGLSWGLMVKKREIFRSCFDNFEYDKIAAYEEADIERIMDTEGMIRSRRKIEAVIHNAQCFQALRAEHGSFSEWLWAYSDGKTSCTRVMKKDRFPRRTACPTRSRRS